MWDWRSMTSVMMRAKIHYNEAIEKFGEIIEKFEGITPVNAQYRIGNLYEELALLYEREQANYNHKAIDAYTNIIDEQKSNRDVWIYRWSGFLKNNAGKGKGGILKRRISE